MNDETAALNETLAKAALTIAKRERAKINRLATRSVKEMASIPRNDLPADLREQHRNAVGHMLLVALISNEAVLDCIQCLSAEREFPFTGVEVLQYALAMVQSSVGKAR